MDAQKTIEVTLSPTQSQTSTLPPSQTPIASATPFPTNTQKTTSTPIEPDTGWVNLRSGLERRMINILDESGQHLEVLYLLRINPEMYLFRIEYQTRPKTLGDWQKDTDALVLINGGYFRVEGDIYIPTGLTIVNGQVTGSTYGDYAGMLAITDLGPELRWMAQEPYTPGESIEFALQSYPLLIKPGGVLGFPVQYEDYKQARRSVIARDFKGRFVLIVASRGIFTLHQLSLFLAESDLNLDIALNLDGGPSSGILLADPYEEIKSLSPLPVVIAVYAR